MCVWNIKKVIYELFKKGALNKLKLNSYDENENNCSFIKMSYIHLDYLIGLSLESDIPSINLQIISLIIVRNRGLI